LNFIYDAFGNKLEKEQMNLPAAVITSHKPKLIPLISALLFIKKSPLLKMELPKQAQQPYNS